MATKIPSKPRTAPQVTPKQDDGGAVVLERLPQRVQPPQMFQVLMLNDDFTPMEFVVMVIQEFFAKGFRDGHADHAENPFGWKRGVRRVFSGCRGDQGRPGDGSGTKVGPSFAVCK